MDINLLKKKIFTPSFFAYLCIFAPHFSAIFKEPNLRFESAHLTSSKRLFDKTAPILRVVNKNNKLNTPYFSKLKVKPLFLLTTAVLDIYTFLPPVSAYLFISCMNETSVSFPSFFSKNTPY